MHQHQLEDAEEEEEEFGEKFEFDDSDEDSGQGKTPDEDGGIYSSSGNTAPQQPVVLTTFQGPVLPPPMPCIDQGSDSGASGGQENQRSSPGRIPNDK